MGRYNDGLIASMGEDNELFYEMVEEQHERNKKPEPWIGSGTRELAEKTEALTSHDYGEFRTYDEWDAHMTRKRDEMSRAIRRTQGAKAAEKFDELPRGEWMELLARNN